MLFNKKENRFEKKDNICLFLFRICSIKLFKFIENNCVKVIQNGGKSDCYRFGKYSVISLFVDMKYRPCEKDRKK